MESANAEFQSLNARLQTLLVQQHEEAELLSLAASSTREALDALPAGVIVIDADGTLAYANEEARRIVPQAAEFLGEPADEALPAEMWPTLARGDRPDCLIDVGTRRLRVRQRPLRGQNGAAGRILLLTAQIESEVL